jgi:predicted ATPase/DNA-binding XRE family transcriptional regulator
MTAKKLTFGKWLRQRRRSLDLTQQALADQAGCARITLRRIESDALKPSAELALILLEKVGIPEHERTQWISFARGLSDISTELPKPASSEPLTNLPSDLTSFIGREKEQAEIIQLIRRHRLVTLTGSGGVGKTRLSLKVSAQLFADFPDGIWFVELAAASDPALLPQIVAQVFGVTTQLNKSLMENLIHFLRAKNILLILDNCEHLLDASAHLADSLLRNCPNLKVITTSREGLGITGEAIYRVPSLGVPDMKQLLENIKGYESVRLFEERAQLAQTDFSLTLENVSFVAQICYRLDGIPLSIELAAARVTVLSPEQIAAQLKKCFQILTGGSRTALPRQQTIRASIDWSWNLLTDAEQTLLRRLAVFSGGWTLEAAQSVCGGDVLDLMNALVKKSLVTAHQATGGENRYYFHEIIRQYATEKLSESGELGAIQQTHADHIEQFLQKVIEASHGPEEVTWFAKLDDELDNLRSVVERALVHRQPAIIFKTSWLWEYWNTRTNYREPLGWLERGLAMEDNGAPIERASAMRCTGKFLLQFNNVQRAREYFESALILYREIGDTNGIAACLINLGLTARTEKNYEKARQYYLQSMEYQIPVSWAHSILLNNLGMLAMDLGDYHEAWDPLMRSREICEQLGAETGVAYVDWNLGRVALRLRKLDEAQGYFQSALQSNWLKSNLLRSR